VTVGLAHDYLLVMRGAERTFAAMADAWPDARIYTTLYDVEGTNQRFARRDVRTSFLQRTGARQESFQKLLPLFPAAVERLPVGGHDLVVSSSSAFAHGIRPGPGAAHVCYCHSPFRYVWHEREMALNLFPSPARRIGGAVLDRLRRWDLRASERVTHYIANSEITQRRLEEFYGRESRVIHPPVEVDEFLAAGGEPEDWFLIVCQLVMHKRIEIALEAARAAGRRVKVIGDGPERERWQSEYGDVAEFLGRVPDDVLLDHYGRALAVVIPNIEEFGIVAVEAQATGRPVLAVAAGGAVETVIPGVTGELVEPEDLAEAMREVDFTRFDPQAARQSAVRFSPAGFCMVLRSEVARLTGFE
jgi:glycosyltransferase involved in cell wall biosynthesis